MKLSNYGPQLSQQQLTALEALVKGATVTDAAKLAGVHRSTVHNWRTGLAGFTAALRHSRIQTAQTIEDGLQSMATLALDTIRHLLESEKTPPSIPQGRPIHPCRRQGPKPATQDVRVRSDREPNADRFGG